MAEVRLENVTKSYDGRVRAVHEISLQVRDGQIVTVLGPSGCGKSTLLRLVAGLERTDGGEIYLGDRRVTSLEPRDRDVAMVFQSYALYPHMSAFENIAVSLRLRKVPRQEIRRRVEAAASMLGISSLLNRRPAALSGGERQRVALARAIVRSPKVFLLDEPLSNLDAALRDRTRGELKSLFKQIGGTVIYVTHDQVEALTLSDHMAVMRSGKIEQVGTPEEIYLHAATEFVAGFVGSPRMNFLPGKVLSDIAATIGIRPEDVEISDQGEFEMSVVLREMLGSQVLLTLRNQTLELKALVPAGWSPRTSVRVSLARARLHRFDEQGRRLPS